MTICACCGGSYQPAAAVRKEFSGFRIAFCPLCGAGRTELDAAGKAARQEANVRFYTLADRIRVYFSRHTEFLRRHRQTFAMALKHGKIKSCLDVGCNIGYWLHFLKAEGVPRPAGVEISADCAKFGREVLGLEIAEKIEDVPGRFDLITLFDVIEHIEDPAVFLSGLHAHMSPGGACLIQLPNYDSCMAKYLGNAWPWWSLPDHLWHFHLSSLSRLLNRSGFEIMEIKTCDTVYDWVEYVMPAWTRPLLRPLTHIYRTSGYVYRRSARGGLIQVLAKLSQGAL